MIEEILFVCLRPFFFVHQTYQQEKEAVLYVLEAEFWLKVCIMLMFFLPLVGIIHSLLQPSLDTTEGQARPPIVGAADFP